MDSGLSVLETGAAEPDSDPGNNTDDAQPFVVREADLSVTVTDSPDPVLAGGELAYSVQITNNGPSYATEVGFTDTLPAGVTYQSNDGGCEVANQVVSCILGDLAPGDVSTTHIVVTVSPGLLRGATVANNASVTGIEFDPDVTNNDVSEATLVALEADLSIDVADTPDPVLAGEDVTFTATVTNHGPDPATGVVVTATFPAGLSGVSDGNGCAAEGQAVTCTVGELAVGATSTVPIVINVSPSFLRGSLATTIVSVASAEVDVHPDDNSVTGRTTVGREADPTLVAFRGQVLLDGAPDNAGVLVGVFDSQGARLDETATDAAGHYLIEGLQPGEHALTFSRAAWTYADLPNLPAASGATTHVPPVTLRLGDVDQNGLVGIPDLQAIAIALGASQGDAGWTAGADLNAAGAVGLPDLVLAGLGFADAPLLPAPHADWLEWRVSLTVTDVDSGEPVRGADVTVAGHGGLTDVEGAVTVDLPDGTYEYTARAGGYEGVSGGVIVAGAHVPAVLAMRPLAVIFTVTDAATTDPLSGARVSIAGQTHTTNVGGTVGVKLPNGTYLYTVRATGYAPVAGRVTVDGTIVSEAVALLPLDTERVNITLLGAGIAGVDLGLDPPLPGLLTADFGVSADGLDFVEPQSVSTPDDGATYTVAAPLDAGGFYFLRIAKPGYDFGADVRVEPLAVVSAAVSSPGVSGFTLTVDPPLPHLRTLEVWLSAQVSSSTLPARALTRSGGGATYRVHVPLAVGDAYTLDVRNDRYQIDTPPVVDVPEPTLTGTLTELFPKTESGTFTGAYTFDLTVTTNIGNLSNVNLAPNDVTILDEEGRPLQVRRILVLSSGQSAADIEITANLRDGATHLVDVRAPGFSFAGLEVTTPQPVVWETEPDSAVVGEFTVITDIPLLGLSPVNIKVKEYYPPYTPAAVDSVRTGGDGRSHVVSAAVELDTYYQVDLLDVPGHVFSCTRCLIIPRAQTVILTVTDVTPYGFTLVLEPPVDGLTVDAVELTNLDGPDLVVESFTTDDGGSTYNATTLFQNFNRYQVELTAYRYLFTPRSIPTKTIFVRTNVRSARHDGFTLVFDHQVIGVTAADITLEKYVAGAWAPAQIESVSTTDGGRTYDVSASLTPGLRYRVDIERPGFFIYGQTVNPPEAVLVATDVTPAAFTLGIEPPAPGLVPDDLVLTTLTPEGAEVTVAIESVATADDGATYTVVADLPDDRLYRLTVRDVSIGSTYFNLPLQFSWSVPGGGEDGRRVLPDRLTLELSHPLSLQPRDIALVDAQGIEYRPSRIEATSAAFDTHTVWFDVPFEQSYTVDVRQDYRPWEFVGPPPEVFVPGLAVVDVSVTDVGVGSITIRLAPPVAGLRKDDIQLASVDTEELFPIEVATADSGASYAVTATLTSGGSYAVRLERPEYSFGLPAGFSIGTPPVLTGAWTNPEGTTVVLRFHKEMAEPPATPAGFTLLEDAAQQTIQNVTLDAGDARRLRLDLAAAVGTSTLYLSYPTSTTSTVAAADGGVLEAIDAAVVANQHTALGTAFALAFQDYAVADVATTLVARFGLDAGGLLIPLQAVGYGPEDLAEAGLEALALGADGLAALLQDEGYPIRTITRVMLTNDRYSPASTTSALASIGASASTTAAELKWGLDADPQTTSGLLRDARYGLSAIAEALRSAYAFSADDTAITLATVGFAAQEISVALDATYPLSLTDIASALRGAGVGPAEVATTMLTFAKQATTTAALAQTLRGGGFDATSVAAALESVYGNTVEVLAASIESGLSLPDAATRLRDVWNLNVTDAYAILLSAGVARGSAIENLGAAYGLDGIAAVALSEGRSAVAIVGDMIERLSATPADTVAALASAGYPIGEAAEALRTAHRVDGLTAGPLLVAAYGATDTAMATAMRGAGYDAISVSMALEVIHGVAPASVIVPALRDGGFAVEEVAAALADLYPHLSSSIRSERIAAALRDAGLYGVAEAALGLQAIGLEFNPEMMSVLCAGGYAVRPVLAAWVEQTGATPREVVRLHLQQGMSAECGLSWAGADDAAVIIGHLQALFPTQDAAEERAMVFAALRQRWGARTTAQAVHSTLGDPSGPAMMRDLLQAGYATEDAVDALAWVYRLVTGGDLIRLMLDAGLLPIDAADYLTGDGFTVPMVVSILADAGLSAYDMALVLRHHYQTPAGDALVYLENAGCPAVACYTATAVIDAVQTVFGADPLALTVERMVERGDDPRYVARHLRDRFGLGIIDTATAMRDGGFAQADVMWGVFDGFPVEDARTASARVWGRPETHQALLQVLGGVYGVTDRLSLLEGLLDVARRDSRAWDDDPTRNSIGVLRDGPYDLSDLVLLLQDRLPPAESNRAQVLDYLFESFDLRPHDGYEHAQIRAAVAGLYGDIGVDAEAANWALLQRLRGASAPYVAQLVRTRFQAGEDRPVETARALRDASWDRDTVLSAVPTVYPSRYSTDVHALLLQDVFEVSGVQDLAAALLEIGHNMDAVFRTLREMFPTSSLGEVVRSLLNGGVPGRDLADRLVHWITPGERDDSVKELLPELGVGLRFTDPLLFRMGYNLVERLHEYTVVLGLAPHVVIGALSDEPLDMASYFQETGTPSRQVAEGLRLYGLGVTSVASTLKQAGYTRDEVLFAIVPAQIAFPDGVAPEGQHPGVERMTDVVCAWRSAIGRYSDTAATDVVVYLAQLNTDMGHPPINRRERSRSVYDCYGISQTYRTLRQLGDTRREALRELRHLGEDALSAGYELVADPFTSRPTLAFTSAMLHTVGYKYLDAALAAEILFGLFDPDRWMGAAQDRADEGMLGRLKRTGREPD